MRTSRLLAASLIAAGIWGIWALINVPREEPSWPSVVNGISFSPLGAEHSPQKEKWPTPEEIRADLAMLDGKTRSIRVYSVTGTLGEIPELAHEFGFRVTLGAWLTDDPQKNEQEIRELIRITNDNWNVTRVIVGNETLLRKQITPRKLMAYLDRVRKAVRVPVSTAEPWHIWIVRPELAQHVDFIATQLLPWWEGIPLKAAVDFIQARYKDLERIFPNKRIVISEVGWPSNGLTRVARSQWSSEEAEEIGNALEGMPAAGPSHSPQRASFFTRFLDPAIPSLANQASFMRRFLTKAEEEGYDYFLLEAFDQPWKARYEGAVGAHWGIFDVHRNPKFAFNGPLVRISNWYLIAAVSTLIALLLFWISLRDGKELGLKALGFLGSMSLVIAPTTAWVVLDYTRLYLTPVTAAVGVVLVVAFLGTAVLLMVETHEIAEASAVFRRRRSFGALRVDSERLPRVSIHVPTYSEPPDMMINTLNALAKLDYPSYEVIIIDNNTEDPSLWKPVEAKCARLGDRFRFFHIDKLSGFKAGALNFALRHTAEDAEIVAVIDSDYQVDRAWLKDLAPHFLRPEVAIVQGPQDYREEPDNMFKSMCYSEYKGFFHIGMVTRNDRNAIIQHGTMTMIRKSVLHEVGGWGEWCITEDSELGLRIFEAGYEAVYVKDSYGKGILPDRLIDYKKQRYRWAYGAIQILRAHARKLLYREPSRLTAGQRYHFVGGWLPWVADGFNLVWTVAAIIYSMGMMALPIYFGPPPTALVLATLFCFAFRVFKTVYLYAFVVRGNLKEILGAILAGMSLCHTVGKAVITGFLTTGKPFLRTPKCEEKPQLYQAVAAASEETALLVGLWAMAAGVALTQGQHFPAAMLWALALVVQSIPYLGTLVVSLINSGRMVPASVTSPHPDWVSGDRQPSSSSLYSLEDS